MESTKRTRRLVALGVTTLLFLGVTNIAIARTQTHSESAVRAMSVQGPLASALMIAKTRRGETRLAKMLRACPSRPTPLKCKMRAIKRAKANRPKFHKKLRACTKKQHPRKCRKRAIKRAATWRPGSKAKRSVRAPKTKRRNSGVSAGRWSRAIDTSSATAVTKAYRSRFVPGTALTMGFTGNTSTCKAGGHSAKAQRRTMQAVNFMRSMAGLKSVSHSEAMAKRAQKAALIMGANSKLSHTPPSNWRCWNNVGAAAAGVSNLAWAGHSLSPARTIEMYMDDFGATNTAVGHRRWFLNPYATKMGTGSTQHANAIVVVDPANNARSNPNPQWVQWPSAGYFPNDLEPQGRWSLSSARDNADFRAATVEVYGPHGRVPLVRHHPHNGYAQPTLAWDLSRPVQKGATYKVRVKNVRLGSRSVNHNYTVRFINAR